MIKSTDFKKHMVYKKDKLDRKLGLLMAIGATLGIDVRKLMLQQSIFSSLEDRYYAELQKDISKIGGDYKFLLLFGFTIISIVVRDNTNKKAILIYNIDGDTNVEIDKENTVENIDAITKVVDKYKKTLVKERDFILNKNLDL